MSHSTFAGVVALVLVGCGGAPGTIGQGEGVPPDAPTAVADPPEAAPDAGTPEADAGAPAPDAGSPTAEAGSTCSAAHPEACPVVTAHNGCIQANCSTIAGRSVCTKSGCTATQACVQHTDYQPDNGGVVYRSVTCVERPSIPAMGCNTYCSDLRQDCCMTSTY